MTVEHPATCAATGLPNKHFAAVKVGELNELARMAPICDVFGALTDRRCYKPPMAPGKALAIMAEEMTAGLDQHLLGLFRGMLGRRTGRVMERGRLARMRAGGTPALRLPS